MSGYFKSLAKQSGVNIGVGNSSAHRTAPGPVVVDNGAPLHVETTDVVGQAATDTGLHGHEDGKTIQDLDASAVAERLTSHYPISNDSEARAEVPSDSLRVTPPNQTERVRVDKSESSSIRPVVVETAGETMPEVAVSKGEVIGKQTNVTGGVVRVGERRGFSDQEPLTEPDTRSETEGAMVRPDPAIPHDYMEAIREWLASPSPNGDDIAAHREADRQSDDPLTVPRQSDDAFIVPRQSDRSLHPNFEPDAASHDDIREFSLSIGSISIVVEEPARQLPPQPINVQPAERAPGGAQPRAKDAFALSRSYFRGF